MSVVRRAGPAAALRRLELGGPEGGRAAVARDAALVAATAVWTGVVVVAVAGLAAVPAVALVLAAWPLTLLVVLAAGRRGVAVRLATGWSVLVALAVIGAQVVIADPRLAVILPFALALAPVLRRQAPLVATAILGLTAFHGTLTAHTALPPRSVADALAVTLVLAVLLELSRGRRVTLETWSAPLVLLGLVGLTALWIPTALSTTAGVQTFRASMFHVLAAVAVAAVLDRPDARRRALDGMLVVLFAAGVYACFRYVVGASGAEEETYLTNRFNRVGGEAKLIGSFPGAADLGAFSGLVLPFCLAMALSTTGRRRLLALGALGTLGIALIGSQYRGGLLATVPALLAVLVLAQAARGLPRLSPLTTVGAAVACAALIAGTYVTTIANDETKQARFANLLQLDNDKSWLERSQKWEEALRRVRGEPLGLGYGRASGTAVRYARFQDVGTTSVDNGYVKLVYEQGWGYTAAWLAAVLFVLVALAARAVRIPGELDAGAAVGAAGILVAYLVLMIGLAADENIPATAAWLLVGLGLAAVSGVRRRAGGAAAAAAPRTG